VPGPPSALTASPPNLQEQVCARNHSLHVSAVLTNYGRPDNTPKTEQTSSSSAPDLRALTAPYELAGGAKSLLFWKPTTRWAGYRGASSETVGVSTCGHRFFTPLEKVIAPTPRSSRHTLAKWCSSRNRAGGDDDEFVHFLCKAIRTCKGVVVHVILQLRTHGHDNRSLVANTPVFIGISGLRRASVRDLIAATEAWLAVPSPSSGRPARRILEKVRRVRWPLAGSPPDSGTLH